MFYALRESIENLNLKVADQKGKIPSFLPSMS
jgi:hypothetical protein